MSQVAQDVWRIACPEHMQLTTAALSAQCGVDAYGETTTCQELST